MMDSSSALPIPKEPRHDRSDASGERQHYDSSKQAAVSEDERTRVKLGAGAETPAELLYFLATDSSVAVRAAVALNCATPTQADTCLTQDGDDRVRMVLARKLAALTPALPGGDQMRIAEHAWNNLGLLVRDEVARVRVIVADLVKELPNAPRSIILQLAKDATFAVSDPILRLSPVLTQDDLLALLGCTPAVHTAQSIARRTDLSGAVCDALAKTADTGAIRGLLSNHSASIREATLDALVLRATEQVDWHDPLVRRPALSGKNARMLSGIVSERLVLVLTERTDLDPLLIEDLRERLQRRLAETAPPVPPLPVPRGRQWFAEARALRDAGALTEATIIDAIRCGEIERLTLLLAVAANVPPDTVQRAAKLRSAKAAISLIWKAGFSMRIAGAIQSVLCNIAPAAVMRPAPDGGFPMNEEEMRWQVAFITRSTV